MECLWVALEAAGMRIFVLYLAQNSCVLVYQWINFIIGNNKLDKKTGGKNMVAHWPSQTQVRLFLPIQSFYILALTLIYSAWKVRKLICLPGFGLGGSVHLNGFQTSYASEILAVVIFLQCVKLWKVSDRLEKLDFSDFQRVPPLNFSFD